MEDEVWDVVFVEICKLDELRFVLNNDDLFGNTLKLFPNIVCEITDVVLLLVFDADVEVING